MMGVHFGPELPRYAGEALEGGVEPYHVLSASASESRQEEGARLGVCLGHVRMGAHRHV